MVNMYGYTDYGSLSLSVLTVRSQRVYIEVNSSDSLVTRLQSLIKTTKNLKQIHVETHILQNTDRRNELYYRYFN